MTTTTQEQKPKLIDVRSVAVDLNDRQALADLAKRATDSKLPIRTEQLSGSKPDARK